MKYDYTFFEKHANKRRRFLGCVAIIKSMLNQFFHSAQEAESIVSKEKHEDRDLFYANGAYFRGPVDVTALEESLHTELPEDFKQFYQQFGEAVIITRSEPIWIYPLQTIIEDFEDDPDIEIFQGRFFRFARYADPLYLGLRRNEITNEWEVVICDYGLLYSEMIGPQGRDQVVASSFYEWLKHLIETDGYPDNIYPRDQYFEYLTVINE